MVTGMKTSKSMGILGLLFAASVCSGCAGSRGAAGMNHDIHRVLDSQAEAWNRGDIAEYMRPYWNSPDLTFSTGGKVTRGWQATYDRFVQRYPTRDDMGVLTFSDLEVREVAPKAALVLGRWRLERVKPIGGNFSLVMREEKGSWVIVHDHTSVDAP